MLDTFSEDSAEQHWPGDDACCPEEEPPPEYPGGTGTAGAGQVRASVDSTGRVVGIEIDDSALSSSGARLGEAVRTAVNAALDDLTDRLSEGDLAGLDGELDRVTAELDRELDQRPPEQR